MALSLPRRLLACAGTLAVLVSGFAVTTVPARAAVPDAFAFALVTAAGTPVASGTTPAATTVTTGPPGQYQVTFPGKAAKNGVAHVSAINSAPHWCQLTSFGIVSSDEVLNINCYKVPGTLDATAFSVIFDSSSGTVPGPGRFGYLNSQISGSLLSTYNSVGAANGVTHTSTGTWTATFTGLATPTSLDGSLQATAVNPQVPARCKVTSWSSASTGQTVQVACYDASGKPLDTQFTLTYQYQRALYGGLNPPRNFGYVWTAAPSTLASTNYNNVTAGLNSYGLATVTTVKFPMLSASPDDVQVTATGQGPNFCGLVSPWTPGSATVAQVNCFTPGGGAVTNGSLVSYNSAV